MLFPPSQVGKAEKVVERSKRWWKDHAKVVECVKCTCELPNSMKALLFCQNTRIINMKIEHVGLDHRGQYFFSIITRSHFVPNPSTLHSNP